VKGRRLGEKGGKKIKNIKQYTRVLCKTLGFGLSKTTTRGKRGNNSHNLSCTIGKGGISQIEVTEKKRSWIVKTNCSKRSTQTARKKQCVIPGGEEG